MWRLAWVSISFFLLLDGDIPQAFRTRSQTDSPAEIPPGQSLPVLPDLSSGSPPQGQDKEASRLRPESRLALVRYISGEFARARKPLPAGKRGFRIKAGEPLDEKALRMAVATNGSAANPGDSVQVTRLEFRDREIVLDINGGGRVKTRWRDRIHIEAGGLPRVTTTTTPANAPPGFHGTGSTLVVDFGGPLPDMTPDKLKHYLADLLDFSKQRSASVHWLDSLAPEFKKAIEEKRAIVGMDREMVVAAMGKPERKVRERNPDGLETEDWIYGEPPGKTVFVRFSGDRVISVKRFQ